MPSNPQPSLRFALAICIALVVAIVVYPFQPFTGSILLVEAVFLLLGIAAGGAWALADRA